MRKYLFIITLLALLLSLSVSSLAISNEYTFSNMWNRSVFAKSYIIANNTNYLSDVTTASMLKFSNGVDETSIGYQDSVYFSGISYENERASSFDISIPMGIHLNEYNTLDYCMYLLLPGDYSEVIINSIAVLSNGSTLNITTSLTEYDSGGLYSQIPNSFGGIESVNTVYSAEDVYVLDLYLDPSSNIDIDYLTISMSLSSSAGSFVLGAFGSTEVVSLPDYVDSYLATLSNRINLTNNRILTLINELRTTNSKIDDVLSAISSSSAGTTVLTQFLQTPSAEQSEVTENLEKLVEEAKKELEEIKEVISSVSAPTADDLIAANTDGVDAALGIIDNEQTQQVFSSIFEKLNFLPGLITAILAIATVGYVLFGKKA